MAHSARTYGRPPRSFRRRPQGRWHGAGGGGAGAAMAWGGRWADAEEDDLGEEMSHEGICRRGSLVGCCGLRRGRSPRAG